MISNEPVDFNRLTHLNCHERIISWDPSILATLFLDLVSQIYSYHNQVRRVMPLKIIDSATLPLNLTHYKWTTFRKTKAGVKLHLRLVFMGKDNVYPDKAIMTTADEHNRNQLEILVDIDNKEVMYVFDCGYVDYERFDRLIQLSFVMRWSISGCCKIVQRNTFRIVEVEDTKGNVLRLITNRFDLFADEI